MAKSGEYSDVLRAIGRFLDIQEALEIEIVDEGPFLRASWQTTAGARERRTYRAFDLDRLRREARLLRTSPDGTPSAGRSEALRTLGGELDRTDCEFLSLMQVEDGFQVTTLDAGRHTTRTFSQSEISAMSVEQRLRRRPLPEQRGPMAILRFSH